MGIGSPDVCSQAIGQWPCFTRMIFGSNGRINQFSRCMPQFQARYIFIEGMCAYTSWERETISASTREHLAFYNAKSISTKFLFLNETIHSLYLGRN